MSLYSDYSYDFGSGYADSSSDAVMGILVVLIAFLIIFLIIALVVAIAGYILSSIGLYTMAKKRHILYPWMAWIPVVRDHIMGVLIGDTVFSIPYASTILPIVGTTTGMMTGIMLKSNSGWVYALMVLLSIAVSVYSYGAWYRLFKIYDRKHAVLFLVLSILFFGLAAPIILFVIRNREPDFTDLPMPLPRRRNPRAVLSLALGITAMVGAFAGGTLLCCATAIITGILSYNECRDAGESTTFSILGIVFGGVGVLLLFIVSIVSTFSASTPPTTHYDLDNFDDIFDSIIVRMRRLLIS